MEHIYVHPIRARCKRHAPRRFAGGSSEQSTNLHVGTCGFCHSPTAYHHHSSSIHPQRQSRCSDHKHAPNHHHQRTPFHSLPGASPPYSPCPPCQHHTSPPLPGLALLLSLPPSLPRAPRCQSTRSMWEWWRFPTCAGAARRGGPASAAATSRAQQGKEARPAVGVAEGERVSIPLRIL